MKNIKALVALITLVILLLLLGLVMEGEDKQSDSKDFFQKNEVSIISANFYCPNNFYMNAEFRNSSDNSKSLVNLTMSDGRKYTLPLAISASGARYANKDESFIFWNKGDSATIIENGVVTHDECSVPEKTSSRD